MPFHTIWSVDLGKSSLKAVKLHRDRSNVEILAIDKVDYPLSADGVDSATQSKEALSVFRSRNDVRDPVVVAHPGQGTFSRFIKVPAFDQKKAKDMVRYEATQQIPFPLDEVVWDYHMIHREYLPGEEREIGLFAVRREAIDDYLLDFTKEGLAVEMLAIGYLGLFNFVKYDINPKEPAIVLDIGASHTDLILVDGERFWVRALPHSGNDVTKAIMARFKLEFPEAEKLKIETSKTPKQAAKIFQTVIQPKLQELVQEVHRSIGYYRSQAGEVKFTALYLLGNGSRIVGIKKFLEDRLGIPVERVQSIARVRVNRDVNVKLLQSELPAFGTALGCGIQAVGVGSCQVDLVPKEEKVRKEVHRKKKHVFFAAGILLLFILGAYALLNGKIERAKSALAGMSDLPRFYPKDIKSLQEGAGEQIKVKLGLLKGVAEARQGSLAALRAVEDVLAKIPNAKAEEAIVEKEKPEGKTEALKKAEAALSEKLWVPYMKIALIQYPETVAATRTRTRASDKEKEKEKAGTVPAYKTSAYVVLKARSAETESTKALQDMFVKPLQDALTLGQVTKLTKIDVLPGNNALETIAFEQGSGGVVGETPLAQQGKPFYGAEVQWTMVPRFPEAAAATPSSDEPKS